MSFATLDSLYVGAMWVGFSYGGWWSVGPAVIAERYGGRAFASLVSLVNISTAVASYALNSGLAAGVYAAHTPAGSNTCLGLACFQATFITLAALNVASAGLAVWLSVRLRPLYDSQGKPAPYALFRPDGETGAVGNAVDAALARVACCRRRGAEPSAL
jgi:MFS family permease